LIPQGLGEEENKGTTTKGKTVEVTPNSRLGRRERRKNPGRHGGGGVKRPNGRQF